jgi:hypothetical protein
VNPPVEPMVSAQACDLLQFGVYAACVLIVVVAYLVQFTRDAYCWWRLRKACGGDQDAALGVLFGLEVARPHFKDGAGVPPCTRDRDDAAPARTFYICAAVVLALLSITWAIFGASQS